VDIEPGTRTPAERVHNGAVGADVSDRLAQPAGRGIQAGGHPPISSRLSTLADRVRSPAASAQA
jgi:hypothetical protein